MLYSAPQSSTIPWNASPADPSNWSVADVSPALPSPDTGTILGCPSPAGPAALEPRERYFQGVHSTANSDMSGSCAAGTL